MTAISVVIVSYDSDVALDAVNRELEPGDELILVENGQAQPPPDGVVYLSGHGNVGFGGGCNLGAARARNELLVFLNPDAVPRPGWGTAIRAPHGLTGWVAWQALVTEPGGELVNSAGNEVHFTGIAWAGQAGRPLAQVEPHEPGFLSGACMAVRADAFHAAGGFHEPYFLYQEDLDLSLRLRLAGGHLGVWPDAVAEHDYEFAKGDYKWRLLERNRWFTLLRCWPASVILAAAPVLLATELAIWYVALRYGWGGAKRDATAEVLRALPRLLRERRAIERRIGAAEFARHLSGGLDSNFIPHVGPAERILELYWRLVLASLSKRSTI